MAVRENPHQEMAMKWMTDDNVIVVSEEVSPEYKERVDYNSTDHSLCLRKLEQTDTGIYIAYNVEKWKETQMVKYNLMVQGKFCKGFFTFHSLVTFPYICPVIFVVNI